MHCRARGGAVSLCAKERPVRVPNFAWKSYKTGPTRCLGFGALLPGQRRRHPNFQNMIATTPSPLQAFAYAPSFSGWRVGTNDVGCEEENTGVPTPTPSATAQPKECV